MQELSQLLRDNTGKFLIWHKCIKSHLSLFGQCKTIKRTEDMLYCRVLSRNSPVLGVDWTEFSNFASEDRTADLLLIIAGRGMLLN